MDKALYVAMTGASASLRGQIAVAHNIANLDTAGFKAQLASTAAFAVPGPGLTSRVNAAASDGGGFDASAGAINQTGQPLDVALREDLWLAVQAKDGSEAYTRNGRLQVNALGQLTNSSGQPLLGEGGPIAVPPSQNVSIGADGTVSIVPQGQGPATIAVVGRLRVVQAAPGSLQRGLDGLMRANPNTTLNPAAGQVLTSGALEGSNVSASTQMAQLIQWARQYEMQVKVIARGDELARAANSLIGLG